MSTFPRVPTEKVVSYDFHETNTMKVPTAELLILGEGGREGGKDKGTTTTKHGGREGAREGGREEGREGGREEGMEGGREGG